MNSKVSSLGMCLYPLVLIANAAGFPVVFRILFVSFLLMALVNFVLIEKLVFKKNMEMYRLLKSKKDPDHPG